MKKLVLFLSAVFTMTLFIGCGSTKQPTGNTEWWHNEYLAGKIATSIMSEPAIAGVGKSALSGIAAEKAARADARASLAQRISTVVSDEITKSIGNQTDDDTQESYKQATGLVANSVLSGSVQIDYHLDKETGETYVLMGLPLNGLDKQLQSASMKTNNKEVRDFMNKLTNEQLKSMFGLQ